MHQINDSEIEQRVLRELRAEKSVASKELCVFACGAVVTLKGSVRSMRDKLAAKRAARRAQGVIAVMNDVRIRPAAVLTQDSLIVVPQVTPVQLGHVVAAGSHYLRRARVRIRPVNTHAIAGRNS